MKNLRDIIRAGLLRAAESANETALLQRFGRYLSATEQVDYVLFTAEEPCEAFRAMGLDPEDIEGRRHPSTRDLNDLLDALNLCVDREGLIQEEDDCYYIESIGAYALADDCIEVWTGRRSSAWFLANGEGYFFCDHSGEAFAEDNYTSTVVEGQTVCYERNEGSLYYWDSDEEYHWDPEPEPEESNTLGLRGYHDGERSAIKQGEAVSIELEVVVKSPHPDFGDDVRQVADAAEEDSSLPDYGAEIIFGSTVLPKTEEKIDRILAAIKPYKAVGCIEGKEGIGMHISVSRMGWGITNATLARVLLLVCENQSYFELIAQRKETSWAAYGIKTKGLALKASRGKTKKYEAVSVRDDDRLEFRLFRSSVRKDRIMKNVETVSSVIRFCKSVLGHKSASLLSYKNYLRDNSKQYPNLLAFLAEKGAI